MRRTMFAFAAAVAVMSAAALMPQRAEAMPASPGMADAVGANTLLHDAAYVCRPLWRCGRYGCGWRRVCYWARPAYRHRYWRHRHWRRHHW